MSNTIVTIENYGADKIRKATCQCCGKTFFRTAFHVYKIANENNTRVKWFCTWGCLQKYRREHPQKNQANFIER